MLRSGISIRRAKGWRHDSTPTDIDATGYLSYPAVNVQEADKALRAAGGRS